jgi:predicted GIY-YIG superfamily endonuclease
MTTSLADFRHCDREPQAKREAIQSGNRRKKLALIEALNPNWRDLHDDLIG